MNREFVLRDNEVAINRPDGTVIIMNLNALRELQGDSDKSKENEVLRKELAKAKLEVEDWKNRHRLMSDDRNRLVGELRNLRDQHIDSMGEVNKKLADAMARIERYKKANEDVVNAANNSLKKINDLKVEAEVLRSQLESVLKERDEFYNENDRLTREVCNKNAEIQKLQKNLDKYAGKMVLFGPTEMPLPSFPGQMPDYIYIAHTGEVFFNQRDIEKAYNLAKGSVSAYFNDKQTALYARDPYGNRITDKQTGKDVTIGVVRRGSTMIFKNRDINRPDFDNYKMAVSFAKEFVK